MAREMCDLHVQANKQKSLKTACSNIGLCLFDKELKLLQMAAKTPFAIAAQFPKRGMVIDMQIKKGIALLLAGVLFTGLLACADVSEPPPSERADAPQNSAAPAPQSSGESAAAPEPESESKSESDSELESSPQLPEQELSEPAVEPAAFAADAEFPPSSTSAMSLTPYDMTIYVQDSGQYTLSDLADFADRQAFAALVNDLALQQPGSAAPGTQQDAAFLLVRDDYTKFQYALAAPVLTVDGGEHYLLNDRQAAVLQELSAAPVCGTYAQWLIYMNPNRVQEVQYHTLDGPGLYESGTPEFLAAVELMRWVKVVRGSGSTYTTKLAQFRPDPGNKRYFQVQLRFDNNVVYTATLDDTALYLESSDMSYGCRYALANRLDSFNLFELFEDPDLYFANRENPTAGKPVIYLYPEQTQDVQVELDFKGKLTYTYPAYNGGWNVTAQPDGTLTNRVDGSTHYYLFWEGVSDRAFWDMSTGFVVKGSDVQRFFEQTLPQLGLLPREYNDFITYWTPELARNPYNLIHFSTEQYEQAAPLTVTPAPDTVLRVHMVYKALAAPVEVPEQVLPTAPERRGFTVVEWGGTRADLVKDQ